MGDLAARVEALARRHHDAWIGVLRAAGFSAPLVAHALALVDAFVYGFALHEVSMPIGPTEDVPQLATEILGSMPRGALPNLAWFTAEHVMKPGYSYGDEFEFGLELVLEGLQARARAERSSARRGQAKRRSGQQRSRARARREGKRG